METSIDNRLYHKGRSTVDKKEIRKEVTEKKNALTPEQVKEWSLQLKEKFCALEEYKDAESIYFYLTFNNEVQIGRASCRERV